MDIYEKAVHIVNTLVARGHTAYFAGGWVRDHVMEHDSNDIDITTSATPQEILDLFPRTILVGLNFGVVIVVMEGHQFEVATFRKDVEYIDGRKPESIEFCDPREDALRRDFTINGLFYDPIEHKIFDYVEGVKDIHQGIVRTIGNPHERFTEDRLRMVRAFRFAARFEFLIDLSTQAAIRENADTLFPSVSVERIWQELSKMATSPRADNAFIDMHRLGLLSVIFPDLEEVHLNDIKHWTMSYHHFPEGTPPVLYIAKLFPNTSLETIVEIMNGLKVKRKDIRTLETYYLAKKMMEKESYHEMDWVQFYAKENANICMEVLFSGYPEEKRESLLLHHRNRLKKLEHHIKRSVERSPIIPGKMLMEMGVKPGEKMGDLIEEAERIAITQGLTDQEKVLELLKESSLWRELIT